MCSILENSLSVFCSHPEIFQETVIKNSGLINLKEGTSKQPNIQLQYPLLLSGYLWLLLVRSTVKVSSTKLT